MATPASGSSASNIRPPAARVPGRLGSEEYHSAPLPAPQEAAVLYSANNGPAAVSLLKAEIKDAAGRNNKQAWLMLFDLHQAEQNRADFDALSMLFTVKFEQSPPAWAEGGGDSANDPRRAQSRERKDFFALKPSASGELAGEIEKFVAFAESQGTVRLDVSKILAITAEEATLLASALTKLRKRRMPMWFNHLEALEKVLRATFNEMSPAEQKPYWALLFELLILQGKMQEFEDVGLEYAVAFEISPPSWETYVNTVAASAAKSAATEKLAAEPASSSSAEQGYQLKGVLSAASANQVAELNAYAAARTEVTMDMSRVLRIDYGFTAAFFEVVKAIQLAGKRVVIAGLNELNAALLEALGVNRYAILVRRKST
jgi:ABC-type transporter Mla MlaB component